MRLECHATADVTARVIVMLGNPGKIAVATRGLYVAVGAYDPPALYVS
jgi:hypothetical protein